MTARKPPIRARNIYRARCHMVREDATGLPDGAIKGPRDAADIMHRLYDDSPQECFVVFHLNVRHRIVGFEEVSRGTLDASLVHPRDVFRSAILSNASAVIVAHNHPSGDATPSAEDRHITRALAAAGKTVGIPLLDHIIVGAGSTGYESITPEV